MKDQNNNRIKHIHVRFTEKEFEKVNNQFSKSTCRKISEYVRKVLLEKPIKTYQRNQSLDDLMAELIVLRNELNSIAVNYNQVVKRLNMMKDFSDLDSWLFLNEKAQQILFEKISQIKSKISSINDVWLQ